MQLLSGLVLHLSLIHFYGVPTCVFFIFAASSTTCFLNKKKLKKNKNGERFVLKYTGTHIHIDYMSCSICLESFGVDNVPGCSDHHIMGCAKQHWAHVKCFSVIATWTATTICSVCGCAMFCSAW